MKKTALLINISCILMSAVMIFALFILSFVLQIFDNSVETIIGRVLWVIIYFMLPIVSFILPIILTIKLRFSIKKSIIAYALSVIIYAIVSWGTIFCVYGYLNDFTQEKWRKYPSERHCMIQDMANEINFIGMTREQVIETLGEPSGPYSDADETDLIDYYIGSFVIDPTMITFVFEENKVTEVYQYTEFRTNKKPLLNKPTYKTN